MRDDRGSPGATPAVPLVLPRSELRVPVIDLAAFVLRHVSRDVVAVAKLDVEGHEYEILPKLLSTGAACRVREFGVEWHRSHEHGAARGAWERFARPANASGCTRSREMDDETFHRDPHPLPRRPERDADDWSTKNVLADGFFWVPAHLRSPPPPDAPPPWKGRSRAKMKELADRRAGGQDKAAERRSKKIARRQNAVRAGPPKAPAGLRPTGTSTGRADM